MKKSIVEKIFYVGAIASLGAAVAMSLLTCATALALLLASPFIADKDEESIKSLLWLEARLLSIAVGSMAIGVAIGWQERTSEPAESYLVAMKPDLQEAQQEGQTQEIQTPCYSCKYESGSFFLPCAVHPLGRVEVECKDYEFVDFLKGK